MKVIRYLPRGYDDCNDPVSMLSLEEAEETFYLDDDGTVYVEDLHTNTLITWPGIIDELGINHLIN